MKTKTTLLFLLIIFITGISTVTSCKKEEQAEGIDRQLYDMAKVSTGFTWYKNTDVQLPKSSGSGHTPPLLRTRYNAVAAASLDSTGKVAAGASFAEGSLVVKELYADATTLERYAILYKQAANENADANGWVWGYINADGTVSTSAVDKGAICTGCHSQAGSIDYMLMNKFFP